MKVSVVMACFNGEKFIYEQIKSILCQLTANDELIIIDDCSDDNSLEIIKSFNSPLIKLILNNTNLGVISSFEKGLNIAKNELIFLADQDDIWGIKKVSLYKEKFLKHGCNVVCSDAEFIDSDGNKMFSSFFDSEFSYGFSSNLFLNFIKNRYLGCTLAFKKELIKYMIPFPSWISMHDIYIGNIASILGKVGLIDKSVFSYRRHDKNVTNLKGRINFKRTLINRIKFLGQFLIIIYRITIFSFLKKEHLN